MSKIDDGGPAFPHKLHWCEQLKDGTIDDYEHIFQGMSLRAYYVGQLLSNVTLYSSKDPWEGAVNFAFKIADAAIRRLKAEEKQ